MPPKGATSILVHDAGFHHDMRKIPEVAAPIDSAPRPAANENYLLINAFAPAARPPLVAIAKRVADAGCNIAETRVANQTYGYNTRSIGIELVNRGRYPYWNDTRHQSFTEPYTQDQIDALRALLGKLRNDLPNLRYIAGHEDLDRRLEPASDDPSTLLPRRQDPGPLFPWDRVLDGSGLERLHPEQVSGQR